MLRLVLIGLALGSLLTSVTASAAGSGEVNLSAVPLWLPSDVRLIDLDRAVTGQVIDVMRGYRPPDSARNYRVNGEPTWADASLEIDKGFPIGTIRLDIHVRAAAPRACDGIQGYDFELDLAGSDSRVVDQARAMRFELCFRSKPDGSFELAAQSILVKGGSYGGLAGRAVTSILGGQHWPMMLAFNAQILRNRDERLKTP